MAFLKPDKTQVINGVTLHSKIIPLNAKIKKAPDSRHPVGSFFRDQRLLNGNGKPTYLTIHNTGAITVPSATTMAEQYTRATYPNGNMGTVRPHYYVDHVEAWQLIEDERVSWHALEKANTQSLSIEIIGPKAEDNGARLAATLLLKHGLKIGQMTTHNYWMGMPNSIVEGAKKNCPAYILPHWSQFVARVAAYMAEFSGSTVPQPSSTIRLEKGTPYYKQPDGKTVAGVIEYSTNYTITATQNGYGRLKSGAGWVRLSDEPEKPPVQPPVKPPTNPKLDKWTAKTTLKQGTKGKHVEVVQAILMAGGYDVREIDGDYGQVTVNAMKAYQREHGLTIDGWVGAQTWEKLIEQR